MFDSFMILDSVDFTKLYDFLVLWCRTWGIGLVYAIDSAYTTYTKFPAFLSSGTNTTV